MAERIEPSAEDLGINLAALLTACEQRLARGWSDLPLFANGPATIAAVCRRALSAEAEVQRLRKVIEDARSRLLDVGIVGWYAGGAGQLHDDLRKALEDTR